MGCFALKKTLLTVFHVVICGLPLFYINTLKWCFVSFSVEGPSPKLFSDFAPLKSYNYWQIPSWNVHWVKTQNHPQTHGKLIVDTCGVI